MTLANYTESLVPVRFYRPYDANFFTVDNRPLVDINTNINVVNNGANELLNTNQFLPLIDQSTTANEIVVTASQIFFQGILLNIKVAFSNTGASNISVNGQSYPIEANGVSLQGGELIAGNWYILSFNGTTYNIMAGTAGTVSASAATASGQAVTEQTLLNGLPITFSSLDCISLEVSGSSSLSGRVSSSTEEITGAYAVQAQQLVQGEAYASAVVDWTAVTSSTALNVGQTASYSVTGQITNVPLHISCGENEIYEITLVNFNGSGEGYDLVLLPNNTGYAGEFCVGGMEISPDNQNSYYTSPSSSAQYGILTSPFSEISSGSFGSGLYFDDIAGSVEAPYLRTMRVFTGNSSSSAMGLNISGGGLYQTANSSELGMGVNLSVSLWENTTTSYTSLGTLLISPNAEWQILVRRIA